MGGRAFNSAFVTRQPTQNILKSIDNRADLHHWPSSLHVVCIAADWAVSADVENPPLWQADWDDEEDPNPYAPDFQAKLREQLNKSSGLMKE